MSRRRPRAPLSDEEALILELIRTYEENGEKFQILLGSLREILMSNRALTPYVHSMKWRLKDPTHLRDKLKRKRDRAAQRGEEFDITPDNLFTKVNDLVGFRILHLYTRQIEGINPILQRAFEDNALELVEPPTARTWDDESRQFFRGIGIETIDSESLYTSVHYIVGSKSRVPLTAEIQVRTLAEELWGEVDHTINYPHATPLLACQEQIKVLARVTSSCTRLVDSIFRTHEAGSGSRRNPRPRGGNSA